MVIGSTGSIGRQTLEVVKAQECLLVIGISCGHNIELVTQQVDIHRPRFVASLRKDPSLQVCFPRTRFFWGSKGIEELLDAARPDLVMISVPGVAGLRYSLRAAEVSGRICLANKETLVCGGRVFLDAVQKNGVELIPVDSEHSAVFQLLEGDVKPREIFITASGGAVRDLKKAELQEITAAQVLKHPVWSMGKKVTIDSATMVNKGLEVIEAHYLFGLPQERILTFMCRNSVIHGGVIYEDGTVKLHAGVPDMKIPISYSLNHPERRPMDTEFDLTSESLLLEDIDEDKYPALSLAREITGHHARQIAYNAADEISVEAFLAGRIRFARVFGIISSTIQRIDLHAPTSYNEIMEIDRTARIIAEEEVLRCSSL